MEKTNETLGIKIVMPDEPSVRQVLMYRTRISENSDKELMIERMWIAAPALVSEFECDDIELGSDIDSMSGIRSADVVTWVASVVFEYYTSLGELPKNS